ncbi:zinc-dependent metalloprotease [Flavobacterium frigoris]|nr:zinc-dependent metalloprotease family protein [Flavobacterium frigoris]
MKHKFATAMKKSVLILLIVLWCLPIYAQKESPWKIVGQSTVARNGKNATASDAKQLLFFQLDENILKKSLVATQNKTTKINGVEIMIPNLNGVLEKFLIWESSNFEPALQSKYPDIKAYAGIGITDPTASLNFSLSPSGMQTMILRADSGSEFIESYQKNPSLYVLFSSKSRDKGNLPFVCKTDDVALNRKLLNKTAKIAANNKIFKTLRLALSCTGEYTTFHGGTKALALAAMNATMSRVNGIFNKDLALKLVIIADNERIIYTDAMADPYSDAIVGAGGNWSTELQTNLTSVIGNANYDIGHLFGATGGGGNSGCIGCVCVDPVSADDLAKGSAFTSPGDGIPKGDTFDIDFVAHEMGHQLGANHTFSHALENAGVNVEPGSGSTIMGYAGITADYDVQASSDDYFAYASILQIQENLASKTCPISKGVSNNPPMINAGVDFTIPKGTAFILKGTGSDPDGDTVTYTWEQNDSAITTSGANSLAVPTKPDGPLFRSLYPSVSPIRYMPAYNNVLSNKLTSKWESVSTVARTLHFVLTARDNAEQDNAQTNTDEMIVNVSGTAGPFTVTSQNADGTSWLQGTSQTITWAVNGTNTLMGSSNVNIKLSVDGGLTFTILLASNTPNDGSEVISVPNVIEKNCRILIEPIENIYYAVNSKSFSIGYSVTSTCNSYVFGAPFDIPEQAAYTVRTITVPPSTTSVADVNFNVGFTHTFLSDVEIEVVSPSGTTVKLFDKSCESRNGKLLLSYDDSGTDLACGITTLQTVVPFQALAAFNGEDPQGAWTFRIRDASKNDTGTLNSASITICTNTYVLVEPNFEITNLLLYPNPNKGNFNLQFSSTSKSGIKVMIHSLLGKKLYEKTFEFRDRYDYNENIQVENIQPGLYFLTIIDGSKKETKKIVIQ